MIKKLSLAVSAALLLSNTAMAAENIVIGVEKSYVPYFTELAEQFNKGKDFKVEVAATSMFDLLAALPTQKGNIADIFMIPNDRIGELADQHLIAPTNFTVNGYTDAATNASIYNGQTYMLPMSTDTTLFLYNKDMIKEAPKTLKEIPPSEWAAKFTDFYFTGGLFMSNGGYIFKDNNPQDIGLNTPDAIKAGLAAQGLYKSGESHWTLMQDDTVAYDIMMKYFMEGKVKAIINGPWAIADIEKAGVNVGAAPIPSWDGSHPYKALTGTKGMTVNGYSDNKEGARAFIEFLATPENANKWYSDTREVSPSLSVNYKEGSLHKAIFDATNIGQPMPSIPEFMKVWGPMKTGLAQIAQGQDVKAVLDAAVDTIEIDIEDM
ncbi:MULTISPECIES: sugar ABC transporter substrate-binding protein [Aliivibrio]|uniref:Extracellular solute-binding protein n=1 Tax=Aliivibrio finisterrensis TaxID=511998 RepID=A0A4Q5KY73_9GAMM|nr:MULTISPECIES: extracellular solute-binding protein [Aliivibrio]MDD9177347.1 extracellular solute-binding protein [Aliivibrio sp. A6]RYU54829.1 extracellular solute-binding protein [Aliivibrio finisterrensis]RYU56504.1 extracellular solute-binding protein [Aliivibrio finisterrensis]RYU61625.1 extracellular solute-binding protein [Aliivibrio finisterrensis]RYU66786.1 extracellular solute-binding protein [Aliivibrio finisterrensis]